MKRNVKWLCVKVRGREVRANQWRWNAFELCACVCVCLCVCVFFIFYLVSLNTVRFLLMCPINAESLTESLCSTRVPPTRALITRRTQYTPCTVHRKRKALTNKKSPSASNKPSIKRCGIKERLSCRYQIRVSTERLWKCLEQEDKNVSLHFLGFIRLD